MQMVWQWVVDDINIWVRQHTIIIGLLNAVIDGITRFSTGVRRPSAMTSWPALRMAGMTFSRAIFASPRIPNFISYPTIMSAVQSLECRRLSGELFNGYKLLVSDKFLRRDPGTTKATDIWQCEPIGRCLGADATCWTDGDLRQKAGK